MPLGGREMALQPWYTRLIAHLMMTFFSVALLCSIVALARPREVLDESKVRRGEGLDIMLLIDTSESMGQRDLSLDDQPVTRLRAVQEVVREFIDGRPGDRLGLVIFGTHAYAQAPLTLDHDVLMNFLDELSIGMAGKNTAMGDAVGVASNRLLSSQTPSRVMILLTDGANTAGSVDPVMAARAALGLGIKIYTIGVGGDGSVMAGRIGGGLSLMHKYLRGVMGRDVDEKTLKTLADITGGQYFYASDTEALREVYKAIDQLERHEIEEEITYQYREAYHGWVWASLFGWLMVFATGLGRVGRLLR